jgi:adenosylcobinamide kinase/adenosylcobinamide-phosphate guanylyltransferase
MVSNEVGLGIVPDTKLGRQFREIAGALNQQIAEIVDSVHFIVSGLPIILKDNFERQ